MRKKKPIPEKFLAVMADRFGALADGTRLAILQCLMHDGERNVTHIVAATGRSAANVSKHLRHLRDRGLVARRKDGLQVYYRLDDPVVEKLCHLVCESLLDELGEEFGADPC